jgi:hypothetical protein
MLGVVVACEPPEYACGVEEGFAGVIRGRSDGSNAIGGRAKGDEMGEKKR